MNLIIDIGNTAAKVALFDGGEMVEVLTESNQSLDCLEALCAKYPVEQGIVATVIDLSERVLAALVALPFPLLWLDSKTPLPVTNLYETPETLGYDRMAAVVGANEQYPRRDILVIDAGTCITYEFIDSKGQYHGGNISPGMQMRFKALNQFTGRLPLIDSNGRKLPMGRDTETAIRAGLRRIESLLLAVVCPMGRSNRKREKITYKKDRFISRFVLFWQRIYKELLDS